MPIDKRTVGARLREARMHQQLSTVDVASAIGMLETRLGDIEAGTDLTGDELLMLASFYRHNFRDFLDGTRAAPFNESDILYRRHGNEFSSADRRSVQEFLFLCESEAELATSLGKTFEPFRFVPRGSFFKAHGEHAASALRTHLGFSPTEIPSDLFFHFRRLGIRIFRRRLESNQISGLFIQHPVAGACVLINYFDDLYRQRFSVAHEVAHTILDVDQTAVVSFFDRNDLVETRANTFASHFLIPRSTLPNLTEWNQQLAVHWAQRFRVSTAVLSISLKEAKLVDAATALLIRSARIPGIEKFETEIAPSLTSHQIKRRLALIEKGLSDHYVGICFDAYHERQISIGRLAEVLLTDRFGLSELAQLYGRTTSHDL